MTLTNARVTWFQIKMDREWKINSWFQVHELSTNTYLSSTTALKEEKTFNC